MDPFGSLTGGTIDVDHKSTILKSRRRVRDEEVEALMFAKALGVPVQAVHEVRELREGGTAFSMDFVPGEPLEAAWPRLSVD